MKLEKDGKWTQLLLSLICFTAYISLFIAVIAKAFSTNAYGLLLS